MKYIKLFETYFSTERLEDMLDTIDEMFTDAKDDGFHLSYSGTLLNLVISKPVNRGNNMYSNSFFKMKDISDTIYMMMSYLDTFSDVIKLESIEVSGKEAYWHRDKFKKKIERNSIDSIEDDLVQVHIIYKELAN